MGKDGQLSLKVEQNHQKFLIAYKVGNFIATQKSILDFYCTKQEALKRAKQIAKNYGSKVIHHRTDGTVHSSSTPMGVKRKKATKKRSTSKKKKVVRRKKKPWWKFW